MQLLKDEKVLITGSTGFIGNHVIKQLLNHNVDIISTGRKKKNEIKFSWIKKVNYIEADLNRNQKDWYTFFKKPDIIIHLAWEGLPNYDKKFHIEKNFPNNFSFLKNLVINGCKNLVVAGTCFEYGMQNGLLKEKLESMPNNYYAIAKNELRKELENLQKEFFFELKWLRIFYMFGEGQNPSSILAQLEVAINREEKVFNMSEGKQLRDYLPVKKLAEYIVRVSAQNKVNGIINCCSGEPISIKELVEMYLSKKRSNIKLNFGYYKYNEYEPMEFWGDTTKLKEALKHR